MNTHLGFSHLMVVLFRLVSTNKRCVQFYYEGSISRLPLQISLWCERGSGGVPPPTPTKLGSNRGHEEEGLHVLLSLSDHL